MRNNAVFPTPLRATHKWSFFTVAITALAMVATFLLPQNSASATQARANVTVTLTDVQGKPLTYQYLEVWSADGSKALATESSGAAGVVTFKDLPTGTLELRRKLRRGATGSPSWSVKLAAGDNTTKVSLAGTHADATVKLTGLSDMWALDTLCAESASATRCVERTWISPEEAEAAFTKEWALPAGSYQLKAYMESGAQGSDKFLPAGNLTVKAGETRTVTASVAATKNATVRGTITDINRRPLAGITGKISTGFGEFPFTTDRRGQLNVSGKFLGQVRVQFDDDILMALQDSFWVSVGETVEFSASMADMPRTSVSGTVTNSAGRSVSGAIVRACPVQKSGTSQEGECFEARTWYGGRYQLDVPLFQYNITVRKYGYSSLTESHDLRHDAEHTIDFTLETSGTSEVSGVVWTGRGTRVADVTVKVCDSKACQETKTSKNGRYLVAGLRPGRVTVTASHADYETAESAVNVRLRQRATKNIRLTKRSQQAAEDAPAATVGEAEPMTELTETAVG